MRSTFRCLSASCSGLRTSSGSDSTYRSGISTLSGTESCKGEKTRGVRHGERTICTVYSEVRQREPQRFAKRKENQGTFQTSIRKSSPLKQTQSGRIKLECWGMLLGGTVLLVIFRPDAAKGRSFRRLKVNSSLMQCGERL